MPKSGRFGRCSTGPPLPELRFLHFLAERPKQPSVAQVQSLGWSATEATDFRNTDASPGSLRNALHAEGPGLTARRRVQRSEYQWAATSADGLLGDLDPPLALTRRCLRFAEPARPAAASRWTQGPLGELLGLSRLRANAVMRELELARLVKKVRNDVYQINPMLAGLTTVQRDALDAVKAMRQGDPPDSRT